MSAKTMQTIFGRVAREPEFRRLLMCDRDQAFAGYDLTTVEVTALTKFAAEKLGAATQELAVRTARARPCADVVANVLDVAAIVLIAVVKVE